MPRLQAKNNAYTTLSAQLAQAASSGTVADGSLLPTPPFRLTILDANGDVAEIIEVGALSVNTISSLTRGLEGTSDQTHDSGVVVEARWTAGMYDDLTDLDINAQVDDYQLVLADRDKQIDMNKGTAVTLTIPANATVAFPVGTQILVRQLGAGQATVAAAGGVTLQSAGSNVKTRVQHSVIGLIKTASDTWLLCGDLGA